MTDRHPEPRPIQSGDIIEVLVTHGGGYRDPDQSIYDGGIEEWRTAYVGAHIHDQAFVLDVQGLGHYFNGITHRAWDEAQGAWTGGSPFPIRAVRPKAPDPD